MQKPQININGNSATSLCQEYCDCRLAIEKAIKTVQDRGPHGRNYPTIEEHKLAVNEHIARMEKLKDLKTEFLILEDYCASFIK